MTKTVSPPQVILTCLAPQQQLLLSFQEGVVDETGGRDGSSRQMYVLLCSPGRRASRRAAAPLAPPREPLGWAACINVATSAPGFNAARRAVANASSLKQVEKACRRERSQMREQDLI